MTANIRTYQRTPAAPFAPKPPPPPRRMTRRERTLDRLAAQYDDTLLIWHAKDGEYVGFEGTSPDRVCVAVQAFGSENERRGE